MSDEEIKRDIKKIMSQLKQFNSWEEIIKVETKYMTIIAELIVFYKRATGKDLTEEIIKLLKESEDTNGK